MGKDRCIILIDGSNFYFKLRDLRLQNLLHFDFSGFARMLTGNKRIVRATYYVGAVRTDATKKAQRLFSEQRRLLAHLKKHSFRYTLGYLLKSNGTFHEKGVDVRIAVDLLEASYENLADRLILVSSDTDLLPAIEKAKSKGKVIEYIGFAHRPSLAMKTKCTTYRMLRKEDILPFVKEKA